MYGDQYIIVALFPRKLRCRNVIAYYDSEERYAFRHGGRMTGLN